MMKKHWIQSGMVLIIPLVLWGCFGTGYKKTDSGLEYKIHKNNKDGMSASVGDMLTVVLVYKNNKDSVLLDSRKNSAPFRMPLFKPTYPGDIYEGLSMLKTGDSATFLILADSFYMRTLQLKELPMGMVSGSKLKFDVKLVSIQKKADYDKEQKARMEQQMKMMEEMKAKEMKDLQQYITDNKIKAKLMASGLYYMETKRGTGPVAVSGDKVTVKYKGMLLDGTVFDDSEKHGQPFEFTLGRGEVIRGWDEGIALMRKGGKAKLIIPSKLAYDFQGQGKIPPFTTLMFEVELQKVDHPQPGTGINPGAAMDQNPVVKPGEKAKPQPNPAQKNTNEAK